MEENKPESDKLIDAVEKQFLDFLYDLCEDWHLWDEQEQGIYPIERLLNPIGKKIEELKNKYILRKGYEC